MRHLVISIVTITVMAAPAAADMHRTIEFPVPWPKQVTQNIFVSAMTAVLPFGQNWGAFQGTHNLSDSKELLNTPPSIEGTFFNVYPLITLPPDEPQGDFPPVPLMAVILYLPPGGDPGQPDFVRPDQFTGVGAASLFTEHGTEIALTSQDHAGLDAVPTGMNGAQFDWNWDAYIPPGSGRQGTFWTMQTTEPIPVEELFVPEPTTLVMILPALVLCRRRLR